MISLRVCRTFVLSLFVVASCFLSADRFVYAEEGTASLDQLDQLEKEINSLSKGTTSSNTSGDPSATSAMTTSKKPKNIVEIDIRGNQIVSTSTILSKIKSRRGQALNQNTVNEDLKRLYAAGFFQDIQMEVEEVANGHKIIIVVVEKPIVREITITGFTKFKEDKIRKELKLLEGQILDRKAVKEGVEAVRKLYRNKGFRFVDISSEVDVNRFSKEANIRIEIKEGGKFKIKSVSFEGVTAFKEKKLKKIMKTKSKGFPLRSGVYKEGDFQKDLERLRLFYQQEGYLDVRVSHDFEYDQEEQRIHIKIIIEEGQHYVTGDVRVEGNKLFPESEIWEQLEMLPGMTYSQFYLSQDIERIRSYYHERGYMDARVVPDVQLNRQTGKVDLVYQIQEGDLYFVEKVAVRGNTKTKDKVIRRELRIRPGDRFDGDKIQKSKQNLENLGFFEEVTYDTEPSGSAPNRKDLIFRIKERRTGELSFGGGVSSVDKFVGFAEVSQRNFDLFNPPRFTGGGQKLSLRARIGTISQNFNLSFVEPYLFDKPVALATDLFNTSFDDNNVDFEQERRGFNGSLSRKFKDIYSIGTGYTLERVELDDLSDDAPRIVRDFEGTNWLSRVKLFGSYDTRDNVFRPTKGILASVSTELVGSFLGGDQDFYVVQGSIAKYWKVFKDHVIETKLRLGTSQEFGDSDAVPVFDRFYAGGLGSVRGYNFRRVGPIEAGDAIGGQTMAIANLEYTFPFPRLEAFRGSFFLDAGNVDEDSFNLEASDTAVSIGPGIKIKTPIGPVAFYYGFPIANRDTENRNGRFEFSLSRGF